jgi:hypothetical protein
MPRTDSTAPTRTTRTSDAEEAAKNAVIQQALRIMEARLKYRELALTSPQAVRDYLRLRIADRRAAHRQKSGLQDSHATGFVILRGRGYQSKCMHAATACETAAESKANHGIEAVLSPKNLVHGGMNRCKQCIATSSIGMLIATRSQSECLSRHPSLRRRSAKIIVRASISPRRRRRMTASGRRLASAAPAASVYYAASIRAVC